MYRASDSRIRLEVEPKGAGLSHPDNPRLGMSCFDSQELFKHARKNPQMSRGCGKANKYGGQKKTTKPKALVRVPRKWPVIERGVSCLADGGL